MQTDLLRTSSAAEKSKVVRHAVELLQQGEIVALPTETVYGLAADALNPIAVAKIFEAKERPRFDPLIVHLPNREWLERIVVLPEKDRELIVRLTDKFWPGPFTIVLPKREIVPDIVTVRDGGIEILRRGPITEEQLRGIGFQPALHRQDVDATIVAAPGQLPSHYAPATPLRLIDNAETYSPPKNQRVGFLASSGR